MRKHCWISLKNAKIEEEKKYGRGEEAQGKRK